MNKVKQFFQPQITQKSATSDFSASPITAHSVGMLPKFTVPPVPHPTPHYRLAVLADANGLLIRPMIQGVKRPGSLICISWGTSLTIQELPIECEENNRPDWSEAAVVYGILGCLKLNSSVYVLFITAKADASFFLDACNEVHLIKSVSAVPLLEKQARPILDAMATKYNRNGMPADPSRVDFDDPNLDDVAVVSASNTEDSEEQNNSSGKVKFSDKDDVKLVSPRPEKTFEIRSTSPAPSTSSSVSSGISTPVSDADDALPIRKAIASRLSFWPGLPSLRQKSPTVPAEETQLLGPEPESPDGTSPEVLHDLQYTMPSPPATLKQRQNEMDTKILKECIKEFTKGGMYFAYNFDITTSLQHKHIEIARLKRLVSPRRNETSDNTNRESLDILAEPEPTLPLWRRVTKHFWWNENLMQPFIDAGLHSYVLPVMQGFFQRASFRVPGEISVPSSSDEGIVVNYTLISRRSRDRAGLRYQRRGVDDDANVANFVETEAVVQIEREEVSNVFSYIQLRGSIPLFWTQSGYSLKPAPALSPGRNHEQNLSAIRRHFSKTIPRYGAHTIVNLAEQHGKEAALTRAYRDYVRELSSKDVRYCEYDFHSETKGMKYEHISKLVNNLDKTFDTQGFTWFSGGALMAQQKAVFRVNCIDCLDRTNVVQSAFARNMLERQLEALAILNPASLNRTELDIVFNDLWANNGDTVSKAYAGTSALKGDYTRTGKRDINGLLNDGMNSLARMYSSTFSDWFSQAVIDFTLGYRTLSVFSEFLSKLQSTDPRDRIQLDKIRAEATAESVSRVLSEGECLLSGWTLLAPAELNSRISYKLEEKILLLSVRALYIVSYDYSLEKVARFTRVPLGQISKITKGTYILSTLEEGSRDRSQNYGFLLHYPSSGEQTRVTSYSMRNSTGDLPESPSIIPGNHNARLSRGSLLSRVLSDTTASHNDVVSYAAFKALPVDPTRMRRTTGSFEETANELSWAKTCKEAIDSIVDTIQHAVADAGGNASDLVKEEDIVSLKEAQKATTVMAKMEYGLKRLIWLGS